LIFSTFGERNLPKITTQSTADEVKRWKDSYEIKDAYKKLNEDTNLQDETWCSRIIQRSWTHHPTNEQAAFTLAIIKYIFNPKIYLIKVTDKDIRPLMKKMKVS
jgi:hypothetical protein